MDAELKKREEEHVAGSAAGPVSNLCCRVWKKETDDSCFLPDCGCAHLHHDVGALYVRTCLHYQI